MDWELDRPSLGQERELERHARVQEASLRLLLDEWNDLLEWVEAYPHAWVFRNELERKMKNIHPDL